MQVAHAGQPALGLDLQHVDLAERVGRMPAAGGLPRHGICSSVERSSVMVVGVVIRHLAVHWLRDRGRGGKRPKGGRAIDARPPMSPSNRVYLFDTTLRDGAQAQGVDFTVADKVAIARELDLLGIDYIEGGWPGANPTDDRFFAEPPKLRTRSSSPSA